MAPLLMTFLLVDVSERLFAGMSEPFFHLAHAFVGAATTLAVVGYIGLLIQGASAPMSATLSVEDGLNRALGAQHRLERYARWFIQMRWIAVFVAALLLLVFIRRVRLLPWEAELPLWLTVGVLALCNVAYLLLLERKPQWTQVTLRCQVYSDLLTLAVLLHFSGGAENPLLFVTVFHVIIAGILLSRAECYAVAAVASVLLAAVACAEWLQWLPHYTLTVFPHDDSSISAPFRNWYAGAAVGFLTVTLFLVAHFVTTLADRARSDERLATRMAQQALSERQLLEQALTTAGAGLCVVDTQHTSRWASKRWKEWFHAGSPQAGQSIAVPELPAAAQVLRDGAVRVSERVVNPARLGSLPTDSAPRIFQVTTAPLRDEHGQITQVVELAQDITHQKRVQAQLLQAAKMAAVGSLVGNVVHEVNNPIGIISAKGRLLLSDRRAEMSGKVAEEVGKITDAADRVAALCHRLLSFSRPSIGHRWATDIRVALRNALSMIEGRASSAKIVINDQLPQQLPLVHANPDEMHQVFLNLLLNAIDAMPGGGRISLSAYEEKNGEAGVKWVSVIIEDSGAGIAKELLEKIFDPFFTTKPEGKGTGLGLAICSGIVQSHCGSIDVYSEPGHGTRVALRLPCTQPVNK